MEDRNIVATEHGATASLDVRRVYRPELADCGEDRLDLGLLLDAPHRLVQGPATICQSAESCEARRSVRSSRRKGSSAGKRVKPHL